MIGKKQILFMVLLVAGIAAIAYILFFNPMPPYSPKKDWESIQSSALTEPRDIPPEEFCDWFCSYLIRPEKVFLSESSFDGTWYCSDDPGSLIGLSEIFRSKTGHYLDPKQVKEIGFKDINADYSLLNVVGFVEVFFFENRTYIQYGFSNDPICRYLVFEEDLKSEWEESWSAAMNPFVKKVKQKDMFAMSDFFHEMDPWR